MEISPAVPRDLQGILKYDRHIPTERLMDCIHGRQVYLLRDGETIVGVLRYSLFWQTIPFLDLLFLDETYRARSYGRQMMGSWETAMKQSGYRYVMLSTQADETAKTFYEKLGYRRIGAFLPPEQAADELLYLKDLL